MSGVSTWTQKAHNEFYGNVSPKTMEMKLKEKFAGLTPNQLRSLVNAESTPIPAYSHSHSHSHNPTPRSSLAGLFNPLTPEEVARLEARRMERATPAPPPVMNVNKIAKMSVRTLRQKVDELLATPRPEEIDELKKQIVDIIKRLTTLNKKGDAEVIGAIEQIRQMLEELSTLGRVQKMANTNQKRTKNNEDSITKEYRLGLLINYILKSGETQGEKQTKIDRLKKLSADRLWNEFTYAQKLEVGRRNRGPPVANESELNASFPTISINQMRERVTQFSPEIKAHLGYQNLTHQVSKPGTRWASVSKGSTRRSDRSRRSRKTRRSKHRK
jgi:hypothetical protein